MQRPKTSISRAKWSMLGVCAREKLNAPIDGRISSTAPPPPAWQVNPCPARLASARAVDSGAQRGAGRGRRRRSAASGEARGGHERGGERERGRHHWHRDRQWGRGSAAASNSEVHARTGDEEHVLRAVVGGRGGRGRSRDRERAQCDLGLPHARSHAAVTACAEQRESRRSSAGPRPAPAGRMLLAFLKVAGVICDLHSSLSFSMLLPGH